MSATFTNPTNQHDLTWALELVQVYNEHRQVLGQAAVDPADYGLVSGGNAQDKTIWVEMQTWIETYCSSFVNHNSLPDMFTLATFRTAAGITGFNVAAGAPRTQANILDLQKAFDTLRWTRASVTWSRNDEENALSGGAQRADWAEAKSVAESLWGPAWTVSDHRPMARSSGEFIISEMYPDGRYEAKLNRHYGYAQISGIPTHIQHTAGLWLVAGVAVGFDSNVYDAHGDPSPENPFIQDTGDEFFTLAEAASSSREQKVGLIENMPTWCDQPSDGNSTSRGYRIVQSYWFLKWDGADGFSYRTGGV